MAGRSEATTPAEQPAAAPDPGTALSTEVDWDAFEDLIDNDGTERIKPKFPEMKITSGVSKMEGAEEHGGHWHFSDQEGNDAFLKGPVEVVFMQGLYGRALFGKEQTPLCSAGEDERPREASPLWKMTQFETKQNVTYKVPTHASWGGKGPSDCLQCPLHNFTLSDGKRSPCRDGYLALVDRVDPAMGPAQFRISGTALKVWREFNKARKAVSRGGGKRGLPLFAYAVRLWTEPKEANGNKWNQLMMVWERLPGPRVADYALLTRDKAPLWRSFAQDYVPDEDSDAAVVENAGGGWGDGQDSYAAPARSSVPEEPEHIRQAQEAPPPSTAAPSDWADGE